MLKLYILLPLVLFANLCIAEKSFDFADDELAMTITCADESAKVQFARAKTDIGCSAYQAIALKDADSDAHSADRVPVIESVIESKKVELDEQEESDKTYAEKKTILTRCSRYVLVGVGTIVSGLLCIKGISLWFEA